MSFWFSQAEVTLKPFSGCIFEQVLLFLNYGNEPESGGYVKKVVLSPNSTRNRFVFAINVPTALAEMDTPRVCRFLHLTKTNKP